LLEVGALRLVFLHTPGHADDHLVVYLPEQDVALTADLLFVGKIGGTESDADARTEYDSLRRLVRDVPGRATVWPGHDYGCRPSSTIDLELETNPFLLAKSFDEFLGVKRAWSSLKREMGLR
jgi:glyoxylase-like metal-dependent hydrolase (beta-lactamase superfamily II)